MLVDPGFDTAELAAALQDGWAVDAAAFTFVRSHDMRAASYAVASAAGPTFLKIHIGPIPGAPLEVPRALLDAGVANVLAPIRTRASTLWLADLKGRGLVLYPFVRGRSAARDGLTADQWRGFGSTLRAIHDSSLEDRFAGRLPAETFTLPAAAAVRRALDLAERSWSASPAQERLAALLRGHAGRIADMLERSQGLGRQLADRPFAHVLCHADVHAANLLVADDGRVLIVDWDGPMVAPRERDLLFVIGSRIARDVEPHEEGWFFEGYGRVTVDPEAIVYYRYERILEDIGETARSVFGDEITSEESRESEVAIAEGFFAPGGILETVEQVTLG